MKLDDLLNAIKASGEADGDVKVRKSMKGNQGGSGNNTIIIISIGSTQITFEETPNGWVQV